MFIELRYGLVSAVGERGVLHERAIRHRRLNFVVRFARLRVDRANVSGVLEKVGKVADDRCRRRRRCDVP